MHPIMQESFFFGGHAICASNHKGSGFRIAGLFTLPTISLAEQISLLGVSRVCGALHPKS